MCYNISFMEKKAENLAARYKGVFQESSFQIELPLNLSLLYFVSGFSHPQLPIIKHDGLFLFEWGLIPFWIKDMHAANAIRTKTLNAVGETIFEKPSFRKSIVSQRCLLGVNGFYEWREYKKIKYPYLIQTKSHSIFSLGCIYESWVDMDTGEIKNTFSILTTAANPLMEKIHNQKKRMPLIIAASDESKWIDPKLSKEKIEEIIKPYDESDMKAQTISMNSNNVRFDRNTPEIITPVNYDELPNIN